MTLLPVNMAVGNPWKNKSNLNKSRHMFYKTHLIVFRCSEQSTKRILILPKAFTPTKAVWWCVCIRVYLMM